jgi:hypothetical protein
MKLTLVGLDATGRLLQLTHREVGNLEINKNFQSCATKELSAGMFL